ncbi:hypothetical protein ACQKCH_16025 [Nubsella zeaxanthinifaciens]|uniref:hypothetical protein n=1 Tax=Nubsella zeaxanthinifaciens TaxID=392412 RepID=UPI003D05BF32
MKISLINCFKACKKGVGSTMLIAALCILPAYVSAQISTATFENETTGSKTFTDNGVTFDIVDNRGIFDIYFATNAGWNGTSKDSKFIDNSGTALPTNLNPSVSIKASSSLFKVNKFWTFLSDNALKQNVTGTLTVTGKLAGVTKFTQTKTTGFNTTLGTNNGYTLIDLTNLNGQNYSNIVLDEIQVSADGAYTYLAIDAFTWVKQSTLPVTLTGFSASLNTNGVLKANWKTASEKNNSHFILQGSADGKTWKDLVRKNAAENATAGASYEVETNIGTLTLAGFGLLGLLLLPFTNKRYRMFAFLAVVAVVATACAKDKNDDVLNLGGEKSLSGNTIYLRLAQVDHDGTTTYSEVISVKAK